MWITGKNKKFCYGTQVHICTIEVIEQLAIALRILVDGHNSNPYSIITVNYT